VTEIMAPPLLSNLMVTTMIMMTTTAHVIIDVVDCYLYWDPFTSSQLMLLCSHVSFPFIQAILVYISFLFSYNSTWGYFKYANVLTYIIT